MTEEVFTGSEHYKTCGVEPFDLMKSGGIFWDKVIGDIIKYAFRNRREVLAGNPQHICEKDLIKMEDLIIKLRIFKAEHMPAQGHPGQVEAYESVKINPLFRKPL